MIVTGDAVRTKCSAPDATMDDRPFAVIANLDRNGFHGLAAGAAPIAGLFVEMS